LTGVIDRSKQAVVVSKTALEKAREAPGSTKARILSAAEEVFAARGFTGASTREIAARAGVNISSLHYHWASKETLYVAVFRNIFDQLVELVQGALEPVQHEPLDRRVIIDQTMDRLFDFFADNPNVPKLLVRRIVENAEIDVGVERDVLVPAWGVFSAWMQRLGQQIPDTDSRLFMLSVHSVMLLYLLDSHSYQSVLGGSVRNATLREQVRDHMKHLVHALLGV
jgi:AcrR family transcriptional regulator